MKYINFEFADTTYIVSVDHDAVVYEEDIWTDTMSYICNNDNWAPWEVIDAVMQANDLPEYKIIGWTLPETVECGIVA